MAIDSDFPYGLRVYFRTVDAQGGLHWFSWPSCRKIFRESWKDPLWTLRDESGKFLAFVPMDAISFVVPLDPPEPESSAKN